MTEKEIQFNSILINWYKRKQRILPWRETSDPYLIWISEIILQQTRVDQGLNYYKKFINRFPNIKTLAKASESEVLKYWQGLGYYSRARNLRHSAETIMIQFGGVFPNKYEDILSLKGIGEYTAAAITSFAWNQPYPVVDGNVFRVLSRYFAIDIPINTLKGKKYFTQLSFELIDKQNPATYNQAIMDFGAIQCLPQNPHCDICPFAEKCMAFNTNSIGSYPKKIGKIEKRDRFFNYIHIIYIDKTYISHRKEKDIWKGLYEFPLIETSSELSVEELIRHPDFIQLFQNSSIKSFRQSKATTIHKLSHQNIHATFFEVIIEKPLKNIDKLIEINIEELSEYPVHKLIKSYLDIFISNLSK